MSTLTWSQVAIAIQVFQPFPCASTLMFENENSCKFGASPTGTQEIIVVTVIEGRMMAKLHYHVNS